MKLFREMLTRDFNDLLESWALIFAIVPFGALIFCGMYVGQFLLDSTLLGVVLMFVFPLVGFAVLFAMRKKFAPEKGAAASFGKDSSANSDLHVQSPLVVVCVAGTPETDMQPMYTLRRMNALGNSYLQKGLAPNLPELQEQVGALYREVNWTNVVPEPGRNLAGSVSLNEARSAESMQTSSR